MVELSRLMEILGYTDERSVRKWCKQNKVPVLKMGLKKYILSHYLTQLIENQLVIFAKANSLDAESLLHLVKNTNKKEQPEVESEVSKGSEKTKHSKATQRFLQNIKAA